MAEQYGEFSTARKGVRTPPHNLDVEESLLGAMLLSREAIADAVEIVRTEDFYKPSHQHVFDAITTLFGAGEPVDPVTVAAELQRADLLEAVGGAAKLVSIQAGTPAISNATRYAAIIEEHALLRRLISVAGDIAELGYDIPEDVTKVIDTAEQLVFDIAQRRVTDTMAPIHDLLAANLDRLEQLYERGDAITGVPTGYHDLDELLSGLQPDALYVVGARPAMGKALALDTPIPTPTGWKTMGELAVGDQVIDEAGLATEVTYCSPIFEGHTCFELTFDDGETMVADAEHQWWVIDRADPVGPKAKVLTTNDLVTGGVEHGSGWRWSIPLARPFDFAGRDLVCDPYVLGCWLAGQANMGSIMDRALMPDGSLKSYAETQLEDAAHFRDQFDLAGYGGGGRNLVTELQRLGLLGGIPPFVPSAYLRGNAKARWALLQGFMDTAGAIGEGGGCEVLVGPTRLANELYELIVSLGMWVSFDETEFRGAKSWLLRWHSHEAVFRLPRKVEAAVAQHPRYGSGPKERSIVAIREVPSVPVRCITVNSPKHLYLAGKNMTPTHNTAFALGMATHAALESRRPVLFFSLEMSQLELTQRIVCSEARVDSSRLRNGKLVESDWTKIAHATGRLADAQLWIDDNPNLTVMEIRSKARRLKSRVGDLGLVVVDYLQLMSGRGNAENRQVAVSEISRSLKILARELETPVVALSQLSRSLEMRQDKRPVLADLRESGSIEQDSDVVMFLYRDEVYNPDSADRGTAEIIVSKHRNGPTGVTRLAFLDHYTRFANMAKGV